MTQDVRKLTRAIWAGVQEKEAKDLVEKISALNLCVAFVVSVKHYVRDEYAYNYEDMAGLFDHLPKYYSPSSNLPYDEQVKGAKKAFVSKAYDKPTPTNIPIEVSYYLTSYAKHVDEKGLADSWATETIHASKGNILNLT
jgi:putative membrane protein